MKILYFASIRERIGLEAEEVDLPGDARTVADVIAWLRTRGPEYETALDQDTLVRAALDRMHVTADAAIGEADELALFPPMTGG